MKIILAPDKFKGSVTSFDVSDAIEKGLLAASADFEIIKLPMADGGDGLSEVMAFYTGAKLQTTTVLNPLFQFIEASWLLSDEGCTAFIEMAKASGLALLQTNEYNPEKTSTIGTGQLIKAAVDKGAKEIIVGIGGSATNDVGIGMAAALGYRFLDAKGNEVKPIGENLLQIKDIEVPQETALAKINLQVACDVKNTLCGENGAAKIYASQKGADPVMVERLEKGALHFADVLKSKLGIDVLQIKGGGAAGGLGAGCVAFLDAKLTSGIDLVMQFSGIEKHITSADLIITGEGKIDGQSLQGKVVDGIAKLAKKYQKPVLAFCGTLALSAEQLKQHNIKAAFSILPQPMSLDQAMNNAKPLLQNLAYSVGSLLL